MEPVAPADDAQFAKYVARPELATLLPVLYPGVFPNLAALDADRADLLAILLHRDPRRDDPWLPELHRDDAGRHAAAQRGDPADRQPDINGILGGDLAGFPNGRRVFDNVVAIELRAVAGATYPWSTSTFTPDDAAGGAVRPRRHRDAVERQLPRCLPVPRPSR